MDRLEHYRQCVRQILSEYNKVKPSYGEVEQFIMVDPNSDRYQLSTIGWEGDRRIFSCLIHIDLKDDKIWIQHDGTEFGVANELVQLGIPKQNIVLGYHDPNARQLTEFAVG
ncbi:MAG TPA: XisI protein [Oscillatoriales cyanobacterium M59_W2019_021]|nr:XisI protein [Oscillatoriales cyanobacterium M4454_W2019_049]HIK49617.1 XisI protein [Oscillatoriales cyanobacterium M59_W2019_021]